MTGTIDETKFPARDRLNDRMVRQIRYTGPATYVAGGDPIGAGETGMGEVYGVWGSLGNSNGAAPTTLLLCFWDYTNQKLMLFSALGTEASGNLSGYTGTLTFYGKG